MHNNLINIDNSVNILREYINLPNLSIKKLLTYYNQLLHYIHNKNKLLKNNTYFIHNNLNDNIEILNIPEKYVKLFDYNQDNNKLNYNIEILECLTDIFKHVKNDTLLDYDFIHSSILYY